MCARCHRSALQLLRAIEEMLLKGATHNLIVRTRTEIALYVLNHKRAHLRELEERFRITITISADATRERASLLHRRPRRADPYGGSRQGDCRGSAAMPVSALEADEDVLDDAKRRPTMRSEARPRRQATRNAETPDHVQAEPQGEAPRAASSRARRRTRRRPQAAPAWSRTRTWRRRT